MITFALVVALALLAALTVLQALIAVGRPLGRFAWGGRDRVPPPRLRAASAASIVAYAGIAALLLSRAGTLPAGDSLPVTVLPWLLFAAFSASIVLNALSPSRAERWTMAPASATLAAATLVIALG